MIRLQQFSHLIGGAASHHEHGRDEEDAVQDQVLASFLERGDVVRVGGGSVRIQARHSKDRAEGTARSMWRGGRWLCSA